ncbi:trypsin-like serine peptidase [Pleionea mediterranea]|uniref:Trypsin-like peptidase n=1 Tax=Pleionea mediterranea TaxID=523701 RepID=A0A316FBW5_9GAMM|nr:trypsin-like peptidase domain-containing protein [Pleionea mediterranea]PWK46371.1 trypsin-like peptidase [Pleionea mediterranea]
MRKHLTYCFLIISLLSLSWSSSTHAERIVTMDALPTEQKPVSVRYKSLVNDAPVYRLPKLNINALNKAASAKKPGTGPFEFAKPVAFKSSIVDKGVWSEVGDTAVWQLTLQSINAKSLNVGFDNVFLPQGAVIYLSSGDMKQVVRFDDSYNKEHGQIWTPVFNHQKLNIEVNVPRSLKQHTRFNIKSVNQGFRDFNANADLKSGDCNINVVCPQGDNWRDEIRSVARFVINGSGLCTGTLINSAVNSSRPYFITADHCGITQGTAPSLVFYWNFEASQCDMNTNEADGQLEEFQSGSSFRAAWGGSDFALVELDEKPDNSFQTHWAGWDISESAPNSAVAIHHPSGHEKRISFENDSLTITQYGSSASNANGTHLRVGAWDEGTTEPGSSGSAIWNADKRMVGTLTGGGASCDAPDEADWYGRMAVHWLGNNTAATQLKVWLDPNDTGVTSVDGFDGCNAPTAQVTLDAATLELGGTLNASVTASGGSDSNYNFSWDFNNDGVEDAAGENASFVYDYFYQGNVTAVVSDSTNCAVSVSSSIVVTNSGDEVFTANGEIPEGWESSASSNAPWQINSDETYEGSVSLKSGTINDEQTSAIQTTYDFDQSSGNFISFAVKTSSEQGFDFFKFYIDNQEMLSVSGNSDWQTYRFDLEPGIHELRWSYEKDESVSEGSDTAWIDAVTGITLEAGSGGGNDGGDNGGNDDSGDGDRLNDSGGGTIYWVLLLLISSLFIKQLYRQKGV